MYRITDPEQSRAFYEALGFEFSRDMDIAIAVDDLDGTLWRLKEQGIEAEREPYRVREGVRGSVLSKERTDSF
jgi:hypothetical protein